ncbi:MAG TPA: ATP-binding protein [Mycobacteriales bacterium]|nr:ATP-binding protein [Mycobacteriales bacterium]
MDPLRNPYQPGAGVRPPELAGRDEDLALVDVALQRTELGYAERGSVWHGLRGVGKTVLLNEVASRARNRQWIVSKAEAARTAQACCQVSRAASIKVFALPSERMRSAGCAGCLGCSNHSPSRSTRPVPIPRR